MGEAPAQPFGDDTTGTILYTLTDASSSVVAITDRLGRVVAQYSSDPYGGVREAEFFTPSSYDGSQQGLIEAQEARAAAEGNRLSHQGLRFERFDRPWDPPLQPSTQVLAGSGAGATGPYFGFCHNRNRMYAPQWGRFTSSDPNDLGVPVLGGLVYHGTALSPFDVAPDLLGHFADGMNTHLGYGD